MKIEIELTPGVLERMKRIRVLRNAPTWTDEKLIHAAISCYWLVAEKHQAIVVLNKPARDLEKSIENWSENPR